MQYGNWLLSQYHHGKSKAMVEQGVARKTVSERKEQKEVQGRRKRRHTERENSKRKKISLKT